MQLTKCIHSEIAFEDPNRIIENPFCLLLTISRYEILDKFQKLVFYYVKKSILTLYVYFSDIYFRYRLFKK